MKRRHEWFNWAKAQESQIEFKQRSITVLQRAIKELDRRDQADQEILERANSWWGYFTGLGSGKITASEKDKMEREKLQRAAARRIKEVQLKPLTDELRILEMEKQRREQIETTEQRLEEDRQARFQRAKEEAERHAWAERMQQQVKAEKEARERREAEVRAEQARQDAEWVRQQTEQREKLARQQEENLRKVREQTEKSERRQKERQRKAREQVPLRGTRGGASNTDGTQPETAQRQERRTDHSKATCRHKYWWPKVEGHQVCAKCGQMQYRFVLECPGCDTRACNNCMRALKRGDPL